MKLLAITMRTGLTQMTRFTYFAQPIENIATKRVILYELLLREWDEKRSAWRVPSSFELPPSQVVQLLAEAVKELDNHHVSINLTRAQFADENMMHQLTNFVRQYLSPRQLTVELVECPDLEVLKRLSAGYRSAGVLLAIDDVGSDNQFKQVQHLLPYVNTIKFALQNMRKRGEQPSPECIAALKFWFDQAEEQQMLFTFEGIETPADVALAQRFRITRGQGYYFSRPHDPQEFHVSA
ncbi:EAL domain-containing protein [Lacticaseibacillus thailandensis]|nr:EAL domain-containing protein [Lacticaseibacillus thailandensis]